MRICNLMEVALPSIEYHRKYRDDHREQRRKWNRDWIASHKEQYNASKYRYRDRLKAEAISIYSDGLSVCAICGEDDIDVLCLDHINDDGAEHRKQIGIAGRSTSGTNTHAALKREGWPKGIQVLCANCNLKKQILKRRAERMVNPYYKKVVVPDARD